MTENLDPQPTTPTTPLDDSGASDGANAGGTGTGEPGATSGAAHSTPPLFVRPREGRMLGGVCAGVAERWHLDITLVRIGTVVLSLFSGLGVALYLAAWLLTPSTDAPAPWQSGRRPRLLSRAPALILLVIVVAVILGNLHHLLWFGAPVGLLVVVLLAAVIIGTRRGRWLLVTTAAILAVGIAVVGIFGSHFGTRSLRVSSISELRSNYDYGVGTVKLDLTGLQVSGRHRTDVRLGRGDIDVTVPAGVPVVVHATSGVGSVTVNGHKVSGLDAEQSESLGSVTPSSADKLVLDVKVGVGAVDIHVA
ncbi:MAG: PspC domain-containing protein [Frankiales bacterium]|nr:PspC domain-containing protein [Frankiales bacterium]